MWSMVIESDKMQTKIKIVETLLDYSKNELIIWSWLTQQKLYRKTKNHMENNSRRNEEALFVSQKGSTIFKSQECQGKLDRRSSWLFYKSWKEGLFFVESFILPFVFLAVFTLPNKRRYIHNAKISGFHFISFSVP